jgi:hypothetical protein
MLTRIGRPRFCGWQFESSKICTFDWHQHFQISKRLELMIARQGRAYSILPNLRKKYARFEKDVKKPAKAKR